MRNAKLWSVLLAAVLLCACVAGVLFVGAQAASYTWTIDSTQNESTEGDEKVFPSIERALEYAAALSPFKSEDTLTLSLVGTYTATVSTEGEMANVLFGQSTIWREDGTKLPITINGGTTTSGSHTVTGATLDLPLGTSSAPLRVACANDYTFDKVNLPWADNYVYFFAGSGNVTIKNCNVISGANLWLHADNCTANVFNGWSEDNLASQMITAEGDDKATLTSSLTLGGQGSVVRTRYVSTDKISAKGSDVEWTFKVGDTTITAADTKAKLVIGQLTQLGRVRAYTRGTGNTFVDEMIVDMQSGASTSGFLAISSATVSGDLSVKLAYNQAVYNNVTESTIYNRILNSSTLNGDVHVELAGATTLSSSSFALQMGNGANTVNGNITLDITSGTYTKPIYSGCANCTGYISNNLLGGIIDEFYGANFDSTAITISGKYSDHENVNYRNASVLNIIDGATITGLYYGGSKAKGTFIGDIVNVLKSGDVSGSFYAGARLNTSTVKGNVVTYLEGGSIDTFYGLASGCVIEGKIINNIPEGSTFELTGTYHGGHYNGTANYVENNFESKDAVFATVYGGNCSGGTIGTIVNNVKTGKFTSFYGGSRTGGVVTGAITNNLSGGEFSTYHGGSNGVAIGSAAVEADDTTGAVAQDAVLVKIKNWITGGTFVNYYGGSLSGDIYGTIYNIIDTNAVYSGSNKALLYGGSQGDVSGDIENEFISGSWAGTSVYCGSASGNIIGNITSTISNDAIFSGTVYGGSNAGTITGTISNTIEGGEFNGSYFIGGNNTATFTNTDAATRVITNNIEGGTFYRIVGGSYDADVAGSIENNISTDITVQKNSSGGGGAIYGGNANGGKITGTIYNTYTGTNVGANGDNIATVITVYGGNNNSTGTIGAIVNKVESGLLCAFYGGSNYGGDAGSVTNTITGGNFVDKSIEEGAATKVYLAGGSRVANLTGDVETTISGGSFVNIYAGTLEGDDLNNTVALTIDPDATTVTILGDVFGCTTFTGSVNIGSNTYMVIKANDANSITVNQTEEWLSQRYIVVKGVENKNLISATGGTGTVPAVVTTGGNTYLQADGNASLNAVSLILTERVAIKACFLASEVDALENFSYKFTTLKGDVLAEGNTLEEETIGGVEYLTVTLSALGLGDFDKEIVFTGTGLNRDEMTIIGLAQSGVEYYSAEATKNETYAKLFKSIANLGLKANGSDIAYEGLTYDPVEYEPTQPNEQGNKEQVTFDSMSLVMSNAVGVRLYGVTTEKGAAQDLRIFVNGNDVTPSCIINQTSTQTEFSIDMYVNVAAMKTEFLVEVFDANEVSCLKMSVQVDAIAQRIITAAEEENTLNELAECLLIYIQAANDYKHPAA